MTDFQSRTGALVIDGDQGAGKTFVSVTFANLAASSGARVLWVAPIAHEREEILPHEVGELADQVGFLAVRTVADLEAEMVPGRWDLVVIDGINVILDSDELATSLSDLHGDATDSPKARRGFKRPGNLELARALAERSGSRVLATVTSAAET